MEKSLSEKIFFRFNLILNPLCSNRQNSGRVGLKQWEMKKKVYVYELTAELLKYHSYKDFK